MPRESFPYSIKRARCARPEELRSGPGSAAVMALVVVSVLEQRLDAVRLPRRALRSTVLAPLVGHEGGCLPRLLQLRPTSSRSSIAIGSWGAQHTAEECALSRLALDAEDEAGAISFSIHNFHIVLTALPLGPDGSTPGILAPHLRVTITRCSTASHRLLALVCRKRYLARVQQLALQAPECRFCDRIAEGIDIRLQYAKVKRMAGQRTIEFLHHWCSGRI